VGAVADGRHWNRNSAQRWDAKVRALDGLAAGAGLASNEKRIEHICLDLNPQYLGTIIGPQHEAGCDNYFDARVGSYLLS
jgi:hypothetical protein